MLMQDFVYMDEMAHFDRERIPERVVHAKGAGIYVSNIVLFILLLYDAIYCVLCEMSSS